MLFLTIFVYVRSYRPMSSLVQIYPKPSCDLHFDFGPHVSGVGRDQFSVCTGIGLDLAAIVLRAARVGATYVLRAAQY